MIRKAKAVWRGTGRDGHGDTPPIPACCRDAFFVPDPLREREGHQPRGTDRCRACRLLHHGAGV